MYAVTCACAGFDAHPQLTASFPVTPGVPAHYSMTDKYKIMKTAARNMQNIQLSRFGVRNWVIWVLIIGLIDVKVRIG